MERKRILVVDDNSVNLATVERALKSKYEVIPMLSGRRALKLLYCQKVDLILLDVEMPHMSGVETLEEIREREKESNHNVPVVFLTAKKDKQTVLDGFRLKIMDYIIKPIEPDELIGRVDYVLKRAGSVPFEKKEMYKIVGEIIKLYESGDGTQAVARLTEALKYKTDEEIIGRIKMALDKFNNGDAAGSLNVLVRLHKMIQVEIGSDADEESVLTKVEISEKLSDIIDDMDSFKTKDAIVKCKDLLKCNLPKFISDLVGKSLEYLDNYDDEKAEEILKKLMEQM